jgi:hypothetical protein
MKPTPLDSLEQPFSAPADVFLAGGSSGQNVPGKLVAGISRLYEVSSKIESNIYSAKMK